MTAVSLLQEMESTLPKMVYINWQLDREEKDDLRDKAVESLCQMGEAVVQPILQVVNKANPAGQEALLEVLSHYPGNEPAGGRPGAAGADGGGREARPAVPDLY